MAGGSGVVTVTSNDGSTWSDATSGLPTGYDWSGVSCDGLACLIVGNDPTVNMVFYYTADGGKTWAETNTPASFDSIPGVSCSGSGLCVLSGDSSGVPELAYSTDGGASFTSASLPPGVTSLGPVSCSSASFCMVLGSNAASAESLVSTDGGQQWSGSSGPSSYASGVSCVSSTDCVAVSSANAQLSGSWLYNGASWIGEGSLFDPNHSAADVSCGSPQVCVAGDYGFQSFSATTFDGGASWGSEVPIPSSAGPIGGIITLAENWGGHNSLEPYACQCATQAGDPVDTENGDFTGSAVDATVAGVGPRLDVTRSYDANMAKTEIDDGLPPGPFGYGWADTWGANLTFDANGTIIASDATGAETTFVPQAIGGGCTPPLELPAMGGSYCALPRVIAALAPSGSSYSLTLKDGTDETFNSLGQLTSETNLAGQQLTIAYGSETPGQGECPVNSATASCEVVSGASGRSLTIGWSQASESGEITSVTDEAGNRTTYAYCTTASSGYGTTCLPGDLVSVTSPTGAVTTYTYDASARATDLQPLLTSVAPPTTSGALSAGAISSFCASPASSTAPVGYQVNCYDAQARIVAQSDPSGNVVAFDYAHMDETTGSGFVTATDGSGNVTTYVYGASELEHRWVGTNGVALETSFSYDPATLELDSSQVGHNTATSATPDANGNVLVSTDADGNTTQSAYTPANLPWCSVDAADYLNGTRCPTAEPSSPPPPGQQNPYLGATISYYGSSNDLLASTDPLGNTTIFAYTTGGGGVPTGLEYCSVAPVQYSAGVTCPAYGQSAAGATTKTFDAAGDLTSVTDPDGARTTYAYANAQHPDLISSTTSPDGTLTSYSYDAAGSLTSKVVSFRSYSATTEYGYDASERLYCQVDPYAYAEGVRCPALPITTPAPGKDAYLGATITTYDAAGRVVQQTSAIGGITLTAYDPAGQVYCSVAPAAAATGVTCPAWPVTAPAPGSDAYPGATITLYNPNGTVNETANPLGAVTLSSYDAAGNLTQTQLESGNAEVPTVTTDYAYDADGNLISTTVGSNAPSTQSYDPNGNPYCAVSSVGTTDGGTCPPWQAGWITVPPNPASLYPSVAANTALSFDNADGEQVQATNAAGDTSITMYDGNRNAVCTQDPTNFASLVPPSASYPYDCSATPAAGITTTSYDAAGLVLSSTDQSGRTRSYTYSPGGDRLTADVGGETTTYCYYYESCASASPLSGGESNSLYELILPPSQADPGGEVTGYAYAPGGLVDVTVNPGGTTDIAYDALGDETAAAYHPGSGYSGAAATSETYNPDGTLASRTDAIGTTYFTYNALGEPTCQYVGSSGGSCPASLGAHDLAHAYYPTGQVESVSYPSYGQVTDPTATYGYDAEGNMASLTDWLGHTTTFTTDGDGNLTSQSSPAATTTWAYDSADLNTSASSSLAGCSLQQSFSPSGGSGLGSRNADGQVTEDYTTFAGSSCSTSPASYERNYGYDAAGRVTYQGSSPQGSAGDNYAYDEAGNLTTTSMTEGGGLASFTDAVNPAGQVTSQTPTAGGNATYFSYDTIGALVSKSVPATGDTTGYSYNMLGQMTCTSLPNMACGSPTRPGTATYEYSGDGLVASETSYAPPSWLPPSTIDSSGSLQSVSCVVAPFCVAVDQSGNALVYSHGSWTSSKVDGSGALEGVSCATTTFCAAVDSAGNVLTYNGTAWSAPSLVDPGSGAGNSLSALSCASASFCAAVDANGNVLTYNGTSWSRSNLDGTTALTGVSCTSSASCVAVDAAGSSFVYDGTSWRALVVQAGTRIDAVSCASATFCVALDDAGSAYQYDGTTWTKETIDGTSALEGVSCPTTTFCVAVDSVGDELSFNGATWSTLSIDPGAVLDGVSCSSVTYCLGVDQSGHGVVYLPASPPTTAQFTWQGSGASSLLVADGTNEYLYGPSPEPVEQVATSTSTPTFLAYTPSDSSWLATDPSGHELSYWRYDAYGTLALGKPSSPFGYAGQYSDSSPVSSGLDNMRARWYEPATGAFTTIDPIVASTNSPYAYAGGDPVNGGDPSGEITGLWLCITGGACYAASFGAVAATTAQEFASGVNLRAAQQVDAEIFRLRAETQEQLSTTASQGEVEARPTTISSQESPGTVAVSPSYSTGTVGPPIDGATVHFVEASLILSCSSPYISLILVAA